MSLAAVQFMVSQARLEGFLGPILQGCRVDGSASPSLQGLPSSAKDVLRDVDLEGTRSAAFSALKLLLVKSDVQGLEAFAPTVIPELLELLLREFGASGGSGITAAQCDDCLASITGGLNAATAGFIYAPVLRFLDHRAWQPIPFARHVLRLFDPVTVAGSSGGVSGDGNTAGGVGGRHPVPPALGGGFGSGAAGMYRRPAFAVPVVVTALRHLSRAHRALGEASAALARPRGHAASLISDDVDVIAAIASSGPDSAAAATAAGSVAPSRSLQLDWLYPSNASAESAAAPLPAMPASAATAKAASFGLEFQHLRSGLLRALLATIDDGVGEDLGSWTQQCVELLAPVVFESVDGDRADEMYQDAALLAPAATAVTTGPELAARFIARFARSLRVPQQLAHILCDVLDCFEEHATARALSSARSGARGGGDDASVADGVLRHAPSLRLLPGAGAPHPRAPANDSSGGGAGNSNSRPLASGTLPLGPSVLFLSIAAVAAARIRELSVQGSSGGADFAGASSETTPAAEYSPSAAAAGGGPTALSLPREAVVALELATCDASPRVRALGLETWHHLLVCSGAEGAWPDAAVDGPPVWRGIVPASVLHPCLQELWSAAAPPSDLTGHGVYPGGGDSTAPGTWLGLGTSPGTSRAAGGVAVRVLFPADAMPRLVSALVRVVGSTVTPAEQPAAQSMGPESVVPLTRALRVVRDLLRAGPLEVLWRLVPAAFALVGGAAGVSASSSAPRLLAPPRHESVLSSAAAPLPPSAQAGSARPATPPPVPPDAGPSSIALPGSLGSGDVAAAPSTSSPSPYERLAAAAWLACVAHAVGSDALRSVAADLLGPQPALAPQVSVDGWVASAGSGLSPLLSESSSESSGPRTFDVHALQSRAADAILGTAAVLDGINDRFGMRVSRRTPQEPGSSAPARDASSAAMDESSPPVALADATASKSHHALPSSNAGLPRRLRKFRSNESLVASASSSVVPPPSLRSPRAGHPTASSTDRGAEPSQASAAGVTSPAAGPSAVGDDDPGQVSDLLAALLRLPFRIRPTLLEAALSTIVVAGAGSSADAGAAAAKGAAAVPGAGAADQVATADSLDAAAMAHNPTSAAAIGAGQLPSRAALGLAHSEVPAVSQGGAVTSLAAGGAPQLDVLAASAAEQLSRADDAATSVFTPVAAPGSGPAALPDTASLLASLDVVVAQARRAAHTARRAASQAATASQLRLASTALTSGDLLAGSEEPDALRVPLSRLRGAGADALVLRLSADPGTLSLLESAHERGMAERLLTHRVAAAVL